MGYEFEAPALKAPKAKPVLENGEEKKAIEAAPAPVAEEDEKGSKEVARTGAEELAEEETPAPKAKKVKEEKKPAKQAATISAPKKGKKGKKTKS